MRTHLQPNVSSYFFAAACTAALLLSSLEAKELSFREPQPAAIPQRSFKITDFGAKGDGTTMNTDAFHAAILSARKRAAGA